MVAPNRDDTHPKGLLLPDLIRIRGARQHNLKNCDVDFPRRRLTVVSGVSGSGKSSLVFDTLYAEGQRSYVESLSTYARQFLERMPKPDVDWIDGISPAIAIEQRNAARSGRSTVGTVTEVNDYLRVLFSRVGKIICPECGVRVGRETPATVWRKSRKDLGDGAKALVCYPMSVTEAAAANGWAEPLLAQGFQRAVVKGEVLRLDAAEDPESPRPAAGEEIDIVVDRLILNPKSRSRFAEAVELAFRQSGGWAVVQGPDSAARRVFSEHLRCDCCGAMFPEPSAHLFSFNSPRGACPSCNGFGNRLEFDEDKIVPDPSLTIIAGAVKPWQTDTFAKAFSLLVRTCRKQKIPVDVPWRKLSREQQLFVLEGNEGIYLGVVPFLAEMRRKMEKGHHRFYTRRYMGDTTCRSCGGARLRSEALAVKVGGMDMGTIGALAIDKALAKIEGLRLSQTDKALAGEVRDEIVHRLRFLERVGLGYLTLGRLTRTLSGGEAQRIHLANALGSRLVDTLYVLDEPTTGLHAADVEKLIATLRDLVDTGNTVVVVEHDLSVVRAAEHFVELGPGAGSGGGEVVYQGSLAGLLSDGDTLTAAWLRGEKGSDTARERRSGRTPSLLVRGARRHNLRGIDVKIPLRRFVCLTGVSGSGKSTLMNDCIHDGLTGKVRGGQTRGDWFTSIQGGESVDKVIRVDQAPIGRSSRSNPATFLQVLAPIRELFSATPEARARGFAAGRFSFNTSGGRCPECQGLGEHRVEMHFMADISVPCEVCGGSRFNPATLEVRYRGKNIAQVLQMTVDEALAFFRGHNPVRDKLWILRKVGLGYLTLGQAATTLSGGESQRLKIARELAVPRGRRNLYLLDEPTTGLHVEDVARLVQVLHELVEKGHSVIVIEHNLELLIQADWIIDLGPGGGDAGGALVAEGTPEDLSARTDSVTGLYLRARLAEQGKKETP